MAALGYQQDREHGEQRYHQGLRTNKSQEINQGH